LSSFEVKDIKDRVEVFNNKNSMGFEFINFFVVFEDEFSFGSSAKY
jgi:hypothetical protein